MCGPRSQLTAALRKLCVAAAHADAAAANGSLIGNKAVLPERSAQVFCRVLTEAVAHKRDCAAAAAAASELAAQVVRLRSARSTCLLYTSPSPRD